ncbi:MAG: RNA polymerase sigma factor [Lentimonas sp.]
MDDKDDDLKLLEKIGQGDESALVCLMSKHKDPVFRFAYRYLGNSSDSEEVTEEAFFRVYQNAPGFKPKASVKTWIFSIALNLSRDRLRKRKKSRGEFSYDQAGDPEEENGSMLELIDSGVRSPVSHTQTSEDSKIIYHCIQELPEKLRVPFIFCVLEDYTHDECAAILRLSRKAVETRIYRARQALRIKLEDLLQKA